QRVIHKALEKLVEQVNVKITYATAHKRHTPDQAGAAREIDDHARQGFIQRHIGVAVTDDTLAITGGLAHSLAERNADVFYRVVRINVQVTLGIDADINQTVTGNLVDHVIEKRQAGLKVRLAGAIERDRNGDVGFQRLAFNTGGALGHERYLGHIRA